MTKVLVTGGTGSLGRHIVTLLLEKRYTVRVMSRKSQAGFLRSGSEWVQANLETGVGIAQAVQGCEVIVHAASHIQYAQQNDQEGTQRLVAAAQEAGVRHIVYISIVGIDHIPFAYYHSKMAAEKVIKDGGVPWTLLRATQFHEFVDVILQTLTKLPLVAFIPTDFKVQPVAASEVAARLCELMESEPGGCMPDFGGPEVLTFGEMMPGWLQAKKIQRRIVPLWLPGGLARSLRRGENTNPGLVLHGNITWKQWLQERYAQKERG